jgi:pimeloyl-ACP methyl ester carboxylesterase
VIGHYIHGHGPQHVVVLHGWFGDWRVFKPLLPALDETRFTVAFMDNRGYGLSKEMSGPYDIPTVARDAADLASHLKWDTFSVAGHSMGGKAALRVALDQKSRVQRVLAITPVWASKVPFDDETLSMFRAAANESKVREAIIHNTAGGREPEVWARNMAARSRDVSLPQAFAAYFESWANSDFSLCLQDVSAVTKVIVGAYDTSITPDLVAATWMTQLTNVSMEVLPQAGHYPMLQTPLALASVFDRFFDSHTGSFQCQRKP